MNWQEIKIFKGIDLNDSFVLSWNQMGNELSFELEASIWPESKHYESPKKEEYTCYKPAYLLFKNVKEIKGLRQMNEVPAQSDLTGEKDYGNIDHLEENKEGFAVEGEFGSVLITGGEMSFEIKKT